MKRTYIKPESTTIDCTLSTTILFGSNEISTINDYDTGGDDGYGGYDPGNSLTRENNAFGNGMWDSPW